MEPVALIGLLDQYFSAFDEIVTRHGLEKLKTIGDAYMAVAGVPIASRRHHIDTCLAALEIQAVMARMKAQREKMRLPALELRIGIHTGPVMSGVVGRRKFTFDIWGDAVNTAALMEANGAPGRINVSETVVGKVKTLFELEPRGAVETKHNRKLEMFFLNRLKPEYSRDADGRYPEREICRRRQPDAQRLFRLRRELADAHWGGRPGQFQVANSGSTLAPDPSGMGRFVPFISTEWTAASLGCCPKAASPLASK
jgi:adenylate cyclase